MSFRATALKRSHLIGFFLALATVPLFGQAADSPIAFANQGAITTSFTLPPSLSGSGGGASDSSQWLKVEFRYTITPPKNGGNYVDAVDFKIWIEGRDLLDPQAAKPDEGVAVALTGTVTYVNIPVGKDNYGVFYVHPSTLGRYSSKLGTSDFDRKFNIHIEADIGGQYMDAIDKNKGEADNWFQQLKIIPGLVYRQDQCAFIVSDPTRYPAMKLPNAGQ